MLNRGLLKSRSTLYIGKVLLAYLAFRVSRSKLARPCICFLMSLSRFTCPSTGPLLHGKLSAACTAFRSRMRLVAKLRREVLLAASSHCGHEVKISVLNDAEELFAEMPERGDLRGATIQFIKIILC